MSPDTDNANATGSAAAEAAGGSFTANVNGRSYTVGDTGQIVSGPTANVGKWIAPSQLEQLRQTKDYHGHLLLSDTQADTALAEAEYQLMAQTLVKPEAVREGAIFTIQGISGRVEEMLEGDIVTVNLGGVVRNVQAHVLIMEAEFSSSDDEPLTLTDEQMAAFDEAATEFVEDSNDNVEPNGDTTEMLESKTDEELLAEAHARLEIVRKRKEG